MAFFIPVSIQKRLLRYALSRIQLFDTDALDLDRLDIGLGRRSNIELRQVALRKAVSSYTHGRDKGRADIRPSRSSPPFFIYRRRFPSSMLP